MAALGSDDVSLKGDADEGRVELRVGDETYTRRLTRRSDTVVLDGDPYLEDTTAADLFAFLLESNEARRAVVRDEDLREIIMRPIDTAAIRREIDRLSDERDEVRAELEELDSLKDRRSELERRRTELAETIEEKEATLTSLRAAIDDADASLEGIKQERNELEETFDELNELQTELESVQYEIETERESIAALETEAEEKRDEIASLEAAPERRLAESENEIQRLRDREETLESTVTRLQSVVQFNEEMLGGIEDDLGDAMSGLDDADEDAVTDRLLDADRETCWTCGTVVDQTQIEATLGNLRDLRDETRRERNEVRSELRELRSERNELEEERDRRERLTRRLDRIETEIDEHESRIEDLETRRETLDDRVADLEAAVEEIESRDHDEILDRHKRANQIEFEIDRQTAELDEVRSELDRIDERIDEEPALESRLERLDDDLERARTQIERTEREAVEKFNDHMATVLDVLDYDNIERIWIERRAVEGGGRRQSRTPIFDLHVVREGQTGAVYEDTVDHLSESEREVAGLVFALAGYLVHDLSEEVPFVVLDSMEAIDADRIAATVDYFGAHAPNVVIALLPEDASALDRDYQRITDL
jgi:DNA repair exonuclease SbcCD ATPase subunit